VSENLEEMLGANVYRCLKPAPKLGGWKVDMEMVMYMRKLRKRNMSYRKIIAELGLTISTIRKYTSKTTIAG
jgi:predicted transcriptional regulator